MILLVDNYDSFTYNLADYLQQLGVPLRVVRNDEHPLTDLLRDRYDGIVLSPGPKRPADAGWMMDLIAARHRDTPILGICLGHQGLGEFFGASLTRAARPVHGKTAEVTHDGTDLFDRLPSPMRVMRYHSLILEHLDQTDLEVTARTSDGEVMAVRHREFPCAGVQFHPESVLTEQGLALLDNWLLRYVEPTMTAD